MASVSIKHDPRFFWFWRLVSPAIAAGMFLNSKLMQLTSVVSIQGAGADYSGAAVYVNWHQYVPFLCIHHALYRRWLLMSSSPYLAPVARWCEWMGLTVVRGNPGERSREALVHLIPPLQLGKSVVLAADGPAGPAFQVKIGCVELARTAGVPVIPVAYRSHRGKYNLKRWDQWHTVRKFDRIDVFYGTPIFLDSAATDSSALKRVQSGLDDISEFARSNNLKASGG